jgi:hypothetical protein
MLDQLRLASDGIDLGQVSSRGLELFKLQEHGMDGSQMLQGLLIVLGCSSMVFQCDANFLEKVEDADEIAWRESVWSSNYHGFAALVVASCSNVPTENPKGTGIVAVVQKAAAHVQRGKSSRRDEMSSCDGVDNIWLWLW